jgi:hypothetical protein
MNLKKSRPEPQSLARLAFPPSAWPGSRTPLRRLRMSGGGPLRTG